jgi:hypothetical protein
MSQQFSNRSYQPHTINTNNLTRCPTYSGVSEEELAIGRIPTYSGEDPEIIKEHIWLPFFDEAEEVEEDLEEIDDPVIRTESMIPVNYEQQLKLLEKKRLINAAILKEVEEDDFEELSRAIDEFVANEEKKEEELDEVDEEIEELDEVEEEKIPEWYYEDYNSSINLKNEEIEEIEEIEEVVWDFVPQRSITPLQEKANNYDTSFIPEPITSFERYHNPYDDDEEEDEEN